MKQHTIQAVAIDFDDTLCLTEAASFAMENETLQRIGRPPMPRAIHKATWGVPLFVAILERSPGVDVEQFREAYRPIIKAYVEAGKLDNIPAENYAALDHLIKAGKRLMLLTSRTHTELKHMLEPDHLLASRITAFYHKDNTDHHKPDPRAFAPLLRDHQLQPQQCVYIGDSPSDAQAATQAGLHFIASLESGLRVREDFAAFRVDAFVDTFPDVVGAIEALEN